MPARKQTRTPEGDIVVFATKRGHADRCSETCNGVYKFKGDLYCKHFNEYADKRAEACIANEIKGDR